jgi:hypothetical protein
MSDFERAVRSVSERFKPSIVFAARLAQPGELPEPARLGDPYGAWGRDHGAELTTAVEVAGSQRLSTKSKEELVTVLASVRLAYFKVVSDLADQLGMAEGELHNLVSEAANVAQISDVTRDEPDELTE